MCKEFTKYCSMYSIDQRTAFDKEEIKYTSVCRAIQPAHTKLGTNYTRNMGAASSPWVCSRNAEHHVHIHLRDGA